MVSNSIGASNGLLRTAIEVLHRFEYQVGGMVVVNLRGVDHEVVAMRVLPTLTSVFEVVVGAGTIHLVEAMQSLGLVDALAHGNRVGGIVGIGAVDAARTGGVVYC